MKISVVTFFFMCAFCAYADASVSGVSNIITDDEMAEEAGANGAVPDIDNTKVAELKAQQDQQDAAAKHAGEILGDSTTVTASTVPAGNPASTSAASAVLDNTTDAEAAVDTDNSEGIITADNPEIAALREKQKRQESAAQHVEDINNFQQQFDPSATQTNTSTIAIPAA